MKKENGFTTVDISIAVIIIMLFVSIIGSMMYSIYISSTEAKRTAVALNYGVDIFEKIAELPFNSSRATNILYQMSEISSITGNDILATGKIGEGKGAYDIKLIVEPYLGNVADDTVKLITLTIDFWITASNSQQIRLQRVKANNPLEI